MAAARVGFDAETFTASLFFIISSVKEREIEEKNGIAKAPLNRLPEKTKW